MVVGFFMRFDETSNALSWCSCVHKYVNHRKQKLFHQVEPVRSFSLPTTAH